jgi:hypothetical protein
MGKKYTVTDHAVIRYMERVMGLDMNTIKNEILKPEVRQKLDILDGNANIPIGKYYAIFRKYKCVTVHDGKPAKQINKQRVRGKNDKIK